MQGVAGRDPAVGPGRWFPPGTKVPYRSFRSGSMVLSVTVRTFATIQGRAWAHETPLWMWRGWSSSALQG
jgi:hypothetical protein